MKPLSDPSGAVSQASAQGERNHQEDYAVCQRIGDGWLLAVFDGHGGRGTAESASREFPTLLATALRTMHGDAPSALLEAIQALHRLTAQDRSGSTMSSVFIPPDARVVHWAVLGDSPIAIMDASGQVHIGPDHNVRTNPQELAAAEARGGRYRNGYLEDPLLPDRGLQMGRALGDVDLARVISREPEIASIPLGGTGIVLLGTDGLLLSEAGSNTLQLVRLLQMIAQGADAQVLIDDALARRTGDNVTALVWRKS